MINLTTIEKILIKDGWKFSDSYRGAWEYIKSIGSNEFLAVVIFDKNEQGELPIELSNNNKIITINVDKITKKILINGLKSINQ